MDWKFQEVEYLSNLNILVRIAPTLHEYFIFIIFVVVLHFMCLIQDLTLIYYL